MKSILLIGGGNMGTALAARWRDQFADTTVTIAETNAERRQLLTAQGFHAPDELDVPEQGFDVIVLAIKPQGFASLVPSLQTIVGEAVVVSIMAGVEIAALQQITASVARAMPNTPARIGEGMTAIYAPTLTESQREAIKSLFTAAGHVVMLDDEESMHSVTAISGSGPAYLFAFMEALEEGAKLIGLDATTARMLVVQTMRGAALLVDHEGGDAAALRRQVTSPSGTTQAALEYLAEHDFGQLIAQAVNRAKQRSQALSNPAK